MVKAFTDAFANHYNRLVFGEEDLSLNEVD
jgi:hypothetical protein